MTVADSQPLAINSVVVDHVGILHLSGEFDVLGAEDFDQRLQTLGDPTHLRLNLRDVTFVDSMALRSLVRCHERARAAGGSMIIDQPSEVVLRLLELVGLEQEFQITGAELGAELH